MRIFHFLAATAAALFLTTNRSDAGMIILSADSSIMNEVGSFVFPNDNDEFFLNVLGSGTSVLIHSGSDSGGILNVDSLYDQKAGVSSSHFFGDFIFTDASLTGVDLLISSVPVSPYDSHEVLALRRFLDGGGTLFLMGDFDGQAFGFGVQNGYINDALAALGSAMRLGNSRIDTHYSFTTNVAADPLMSNVHSFLYGDSNVISQGGTTLARTVSGDNVILAYENFESAQVPEPSSILSMLAVAAIGTRSLVIRRYRRRETA